MKFSDLPAWHQLRIGEFKTAEQVLAYVEENDFVLPEEDMAQLAEGIWNGPDHAVMCPFCEKFIYWNVNDTPHQCPYCRAQLY